MANDKAVYTLVVNKERIEVSKEVYRAYYECRDREVYLDRLSKKHNLSMEELIDSGFNVEFKCLNKSISIEEIVIRKILLEQINEYLMELDSNDLNLIKEIFGRRTTERELARKLKIPQKTLNNKKRRILDNLKLMLKNKKV